MLHALHMKRHTRLVAGTPEIWVLIGAFGFRAWYGVDGHGMLEVCGGSWRPRSPGPSLRPPFFFFSLEFYSVLFDPQPRKKKPQLNYALSDETKMIIFTFHTFEHVHLPSFLPSEVSSSEVTTCSTSKENVFHLESF